MRSANSNLPPSHNPPCAGPFCLTDVGESGEDRSRNKENIKEEDAEE